MDTKVPLALAVQNLATLMEAIDDGNLDEAVIRLFTDQRLDLSSAVDRRICFFDICEKHVESLKDIARQYQKTAKALENALESVQKQTTEIMKGNPDVPYKGDLGRLQVQKNASPSCTILFETTKESSSNVVDAADINKYGIDEKFYEARTHYVLVLDKIKKALEAGENIPWAELKRGEHLRVYRK